ncbi:MAG: hypothetical protein NTZ25_02020 [Candidatus Peregrinibacteria bacterium]|nr:hypothetical protein [Candidatus Peregrinibacteria bacterium]
MKNLYLFSVLNQSFKEKNLLFKEGEPDKAPAAAADKDKGKDKDKDKDKDTADKDDDKTEAAEKKTITKEDVSDKLDTLKTQLKVVSDAEDGTYTKKTVDAAKALGSQVSKIENQLKKFKDDDDDVSKAISQPTLYKFDKAAAETFSDESLKADAEKKEALDKARESLKTKKEEADPKAICEKVKEMVKKPEDADENTAKIYDAILARFKDGKGLKLDGTFKAIEAKLAKAEAETDAEKSKALIDEANGDIANIDPDTIAESYEPLINAYAELVTLAGEGKHGKSEIAKLTPEIAKWITSEKDENHMGAVSLNEKFEEKVIIAKACDIISTEKLDVTPEALKAAISTYESGEHRPANKDDKRDKILKALVEKKDELNKADIYFNINAGTDGTDWQEKSSKRNEEWHEDTKSALEKLLALNDNGKLTIKDSNGDVVTLSTEQVDLIKEYNGKDAKDREAFVSEHKAEFLTHNGIFDLALNIQRAREMKERLYAERDEKGKITNDEDLEISDDEYLDIKLGATPGKREERKSGITFYKPEPKDDANDTQDPPAGATGTEPVPPAGKEPPAADEPAKDPQPGAKVEGKVVGATGEVVGKVVEVPIEKMTDAQLLDVASKTSYGKAGDDGVEWSSDTKFARKKMDGKDSYTYFTAIRAEGGRARQLN